MGYNTKNYTEQGGDKTVIGGELEIEEGATVTGIPSFQNYAANESTLGGIKAEVKSETDTVEVKIGEDEKLYVPTYEVAAVALNQADSTAETIEDLLADFNLLLAKLKAAGLMENE